MIDRTALTTALTGQVALLVDDLRDRADTAPDVSELVRVEWQTAVEAGRTAYDMETWREDLLAQVAVSWVLGCVFIRFCEDNRLLTEPMLSGTGEWRRWANDTQVEFFRANPEAGERRYLEHVFTQAAGVNGLADVFGAHNPVWSFGPSDDACRALIAIWRSTDPETGELTWGFTDAELDTRFLGDLYQDLSEHARKTYALLQTPDFIESFILDRTLDPALEEFGLDGHDGTGFRMIDPACGSGHFLLGGFRRLADRHLAKDPGAGPRAAAASALEGVFGVDLNPFAASIARFRLLVSALQFAGVNTLAEAPHFTINVAVGDSLLHGPPPGRLQGVLESAERQSDATRHLYGTEDAETIGRILGQDYHAVVANPPYITPKDPAANTAYRARYDTCSGKYSLAVPFMQRLFDLAWRGAGQPAGYVGQITANSFMRREFGKKLIERYLASEVDLTHVIDAGGAYIPGHGTPTVLLIGRNRLPVAEKVRAVLGIRGEPRMPADPATGEVWSSIVELIDRPGAENGFISVTNSDRSTLAKHPWSLQGGAAAPLKQRIEDRSRTRLEAVQEAVGVTAICGVDDVFTDETRRAVCRRGVESEFVRDLVVGDSVRDWGLSNFPSALFPYDEASLLPFNDAHGFYRWIWPAKTVMGERRTFAKRSYFDEGRPWWEWHQVALDRLRSPLSITWAEVATANHFVLDRGHKVFKQTAPVIKLLPNTSEDDHLQLLGLLNSAVACFWMKQVFQGKPSNGVKRGLESEAWTIRYQFDSTKMKQFPLVDGSVLSLAKALDRCAVELVEWLPARIVSGGAGAQELTHSKSRVAELRARMVWLQEELDWRCAFLYGVTDEDLSFRPEEALPLGRGERSFEIVLARLLAHGEVETDWFRRHSLDPVVELPEEWPDWYRKGVLHRLELIESDRFVHLLERPEYKRRWRWEPWEDLAAVALRAWLVSRLEDPQYWPSVEPRSFAQLADIARTDAEFIEVARVYTERAEVDLVDVIAELVGADSVDFLSAWRYSESGLRKRVAWERTWSLQRRQDQGDEVGKIAIPPKYGKTDFRTAAAWELRGKLDVPKERFISYPGTERAADSTPVLGWAGWDHLQQAQALTALINQRVQTEGWAAEQLTPLLAGLAELVPWLRQWHNEYDPNLGQGLGDYFADYLVSETQRLDLSSEDLSAWRPPKQSRRRKKKETP